MKRIFFFTLILICIFVLPIYAQFPAVKKFPNFLTQVSQVPTIPDTAVTFQIAAVVDSSRIKITISHFDTNTVSFSGYYQKVSYPARLEGFNLGVFTAADTSTFASGRSFSVNDSTGATIYVAFYYYGTGWSTKSNRESVATTNIPVVSTYALYNTGKYNIGVYNK